MLTILSKLSPPKPRALAGPLVGSAALLVALASVPLVPDARACGAVLAETGAATLDAQQVLFLWGQTELEIHVRLSYQADTAGAAWVLPVPAETALPDVALGDAAVFEALEDLTAPTITAATLGGSGGSGCSDDAQAGGVAGSGELRGGVEHLAGLRVGDYEVDLVDADDAAALVQFAQDEGYAVPDGMADALAPYVAQGMRFIWAQLDGGASDGGSTEPAPLAVTVPKPPDRRFLLPLGLSASGTPEGARLPVLLWNLADKRFRVDTYASITLEELATEVAHQQDTDGVFDYAAALDALTDAAGGRLFVTDYALDVTDARDDFPTALRALGDQVAAEHERLWLTRTFARVPTEHLADAVVTYAHLSPEVPPTAVATTGQSAEARFGGGLWLLAALALLWHRRREAAPPTA